MMFVLSLRGCLVFWVFFKKILFMFAGMPAALSFRYFHTFRCHVGTDSYFNAADDSRGRDLYPSPAHEGHV